MNTVVDITIERHDRQNVYYISTPSELDGKPLHLTADLSLTRVATKRAFVRDLAKASRLTELIFAGEIREGVSYANTKKSV